MKGYCNQCNQWLNIDHFNLREDRITPTPYAFCKSCMHKQGRSVEWPEAKKRGDGQLRCHFKEIIVET